MVTSSRSGGSQSVIFVENSCLQSLCPQCLLFAGKWFSYLKVHSPYHCTGCSGDKEGWGEWENIEVDRVEMLCLQTMAKRTANWKTIVWESVLINNEFLPSDIFHLLLFLAEFVSLSTVTKKWWLQFIIFKPNFCLIGSKVLLPCLLMQLYQRELQVYSQ